MNHAGVANDVVVLAHRAPLSLERDAEGRITFRRSASGVATALEPLARQYSVLWVAHGEANADHVAVGDRESPFLPPATCPYRIHYVSVPEAEYRGSYQGFANEGLWPLCHDVEVAARFRDVDFRMYQRVNERYASAVTDLTTDASLVFVQDYHFALVPRLLRKRAPDRTVAAFWHIPWPRPRLFRMCPSAAQLVDGLLGSDLVGMQTPDDVENFLGFAEMMDGAVVDRGAGAVCYKGFTTAVRCYPVGVDWANSPTRRLPPVPVCRDQVARLLRLPADVCLGVGVDRLDYTKGLREKFLAVEKLLERRRDLRGRFVFVQIAEPSRVGLASYQAAREQILAVRDRVNERFGTLDWTPIQLREGHHSPDDVFRLYRAADVCYVASLRDGMNLVAKEFIAARDDERGVLVLSEFTGAAHQLRAAMIVNPRVVGEAANTLARALATTEAEQIRRMRILRSIVERFDASWWAATVLQHASRRARSAFIPRAS